MYRLERQPNGEVRQCETNADGGSVYARREELSKQALKKLKKSEPAGKLGSLSNLQVFNANISAFSSDTATKFVYEEYNDSVDFPDLMDPCFVFGSKNGSNASGLYYNIVGINANLETTATDPAYRVLPDSYIEFYLGQNILGSATPQVTKIPGQPFNSFSTGAITLDTSGSINSNQAIMTSVLNDANTIPTNTKGIRASGLGLRSISLIFTDNEDVSAMSINIEVYVDVSSVSGTY